MASSAEDSDQSKQLPPKGLSSTLDTVIDKGLYWGPICFYVTYKVKPGKEDEMIAAAHKLSPLIQKEKGCVAYEIYRSADDPYSFVNFEHWTSGETLKGHVTGEYIGQLRTAIADCFAGAPTLEFFTPL